MSYLLGTRVPNLGALLGMLMVVGLEPGLEEGEESMLPLDCKEKTFKYVSCNYHKIENIETGNI